MSDVASLLSASLQPTSRKQAEQQLNHLTAQPGFLPHLLALILDGAPDRAVRLAGGIYLKNIAKLRWEEVRPLVHPRLAADPRRMSRPSPTKTRPPSVPNSSPP